MGARESSYRLKNFMLFFTVTLLPVFSLVSCKSTPVTTPGSLLGSAEESVMDAPCRFLKEKTAAIGLIREDVSQFCGRSVQSQVMQRRNELVAILSQPIGSSSRFIFAGMQEFGGNVADGIRRQIEFCANFENVRKLTPNAYTDVQRIETRPIGSSMSCNFKFVGKRVLIYRPEFEGRSETFVNPERTMMASVSYLTEQVSLVERSVVMSIAQQIADGRVRIFFYNSTQSDTKGLHKIVAPRVDEGTRAGFSEARNLFN